MNITALIKSVPLLLFTLCCSSVQAQAIKEVPLSNFTGISVSDGIEVFLSKGISESAKIVALDYLVDGVDIRQNNGMLEVKWKTQKSKSRKWLNRTAKVYLSFKEIATLEINNGSSVRTNNKLSANKLSVTVSSGAIITADLDCEELDLQTSSGASAVLTGSTGDLKLQSTTSSLVNATGLRVEKAIVNTGSAAKVKLQVSKKLEVTAGSGSEISYKGNPEVDNFSGPKPGAVKRLD